MIYNFTLKNCFYLNLWMEVYPRMEVYLWIYNWKSCFMAPLISIATKLNFKLYDNIRIDLSPQKIYFIEERSENDYLDQ